MKKVLIFSLSYYPKFIGGAEVAINEITKRIAPEEVEFHLLTLRYDSSLPKEEQIGNVHVYRIGPTRKNPTIDDLNRFPLKLAKYYYQIAAAHKASKLHAIHHFDGVWAMMAHACGIPAALFKRRHQSVQYLLTLQEGDPPAYVERMMRFIWPLFKESFTRADQLQAISTFLAEWGSRMGFTKSPVLIPNGVDVERFGMVFSNDERSVQAQLLGKKEGDVFLVTTSRLVHKNGIDTVIRSLPLLSQNVHFLIYGIGPEEEQLKILAGELGVAERTRFLGQLSHQDMPRIFSVCDVFVRPSRSEGMGNSFIEAMAAGLPVIATQEGGIRDFLFDEKRNPGMEATGWAVDVDTPEQIAEAVQDILNKKDNVEKITSHAQAMVQNKYDWNVIAQKMKHLFEGV